MQAVQILSLTLLCALAVSAQMVNPGTCPDPPVQQNFELARYLGRWYDVQKIPAVFQKGQCGQATYTLISSGVFQVLNQALQADGQVTSTVGTARVSDPSIPAKLELSIAEGVRPGPYWVLSTDYENYSLVYSCSNLPDGRHTVLSWIMGRSYTLPEDTIARLEGILSSNGINPDKMIPSYDNAERCSAMP